MYVSAGVDSNLTINGFYGWRQTAGVPIMMSNHATVTVCGLQLYERGADTYTNTALVDVTGPTAQIALSLIGFPSSGPPGALGSCPTCWPRSPARTGKIFLATGRLERLLLSYPFRWCPTMATPAETGSIWRIPLPARSGRVSGHR